MPYLHASDAILLDRDQIAKDALDEAALTRSIVSEGLEVGSGSLHFERLPARFGRTGTIVLQVDPQVGESPIKNGAHSRHFGSLREINKNTTGAHCSGAEDRKSGVEGRGGSGCEGVG